MSGAYIEENTRQRERLRALLARLTDQDLTRPLGDGWTVAGFLGHLAFWDYRAFLLIKRWKQTGVKPSPADVDVINDGMKPLLLAIPPRKIAEMVMEAATAVDREIEGLNPDLITRIEAQATDFRLNRGHHRGAHINDIEAGISKLT
jgi:hypothetical protein